MVLDDNFCLYLIFLHKGRRENWTSYSGYKQNKAFKQMSSIFLLLNADCYLMYPMTHHDLLNSSMHSFLLRITTTKSIFEVMLSMSLTCSKYSASWLHWPMYMSFCLVKSKGMHHFWDYSHNRQRFFWSLSTLASNIAVVQKLIPHRKLINI